MEQAPIDVDEKLSVKAEKIKKKEKSARNKIRTKHPIRTSNEKTKQSK